MSSLTARRSQREKKPVKPFVSAGPTGKKRKHVDTDNEGDGGNPDDEEQDADVDDDGDEEHLPKRKSPKKKSPPVKKPRTTKPPATRKPRKAKADNAPFDPERLAKDTQINSDNPLFNAILNPAAALQSTAEDFLESLDQSPPMAFAELVNLILRCCGCNETVNADEAVDYDGVVDTLDNFTEALKQNESPTYPLTSKLTAFKKFRTHLSDFISKLISSSAELGSLYTSDLVLTLTTWVVAMSSSQIRSFRHTATVIALETQAALCDVARSVEKEAEVVGRQREGEKKRRAKGAHKDKGITPREKELEAKSKEVNSRKEKLEEYISEFIDTVFVHRYRDLDPLIRTECINSLGSFFKKFPTHFLNNSYLRYVGWVLSDAATPVRLAAVKCLGVVYSLSSSSGEADHTLTSLNHFTERFKPRLLEMAAGDTEIGVRVGVLGVLVEIDKAGLLAEDEREQLGPLIFSDDIKVRKGVAPFVKGVWEEWCEERRNEAKDAHGGSSKAKKGGKKGNPDSGRVDIKGLLVLLVRWGNALDQIMEDEEDAEDGDTRDEESSTQLKTVKPPTASRTGLAVEALWDKVQPASDWRGMLDMLLLDHSAAREENLSPVKLRRGKGKPNGKKQADSDDEDDEDTASIQVDDAWRLEEVEEGLLLEVFVASVRRAVKDATASAKKDEEDDLANDVTRALIEALPRLFIKYQTDEKKIVQVLMLPTLMNLDLYLEMRMLNGYATLWDDVIKQFTTHTSFTVLGVASQTILVFMSTASLSNTNSTKILELEDELATALRNAVAGREELEVTSLSDDEVHVLDSLCLRLASLFGMRNMCGWMEDNEGGKQSSVWDILSALAERGRLGYKEEERMIENALRVLYVHVMWKFGRVDPSTPLSPDDIHYQEVLKDQRDSLVEKLTEYAIGTQSNTVEGVQRAAFKCLIDAYVLFASGKAGSDEVEMDLSLSMDDEIQYRCAGYIQAEIERYAEALAVSQKTDRNSDGEGSADEGLPAKKKKDKEVKEPIGSEADTSSRPYLENEYSFVEVMSTFLRAIHSGVIHVRHGGILLAHYGRFGTVVDSCLKFISDLVQRDTIVNPDGELFVSIVTHALQDAFTLVLNGDVSDESNAQQLAKLFSKRFVARGTQLTIIGRLEPEHIVNIQMTLLSWIGKKLVEYQDLGKNSLKKPVLFFRVLVPLLSRIQSRDALKVKAHLEQILSQAKIEVAASQLWEPYRTYEKRLNALMAKDKGPGKGRKGKRKGGATSSEDEGEESEVERLVDEASDTEALPPRSPPLARQTPRPRRKQPTPQDQSAHEDFEPLTPKPRPRPKPTKTKHPSAATNSSPSKVADASLSPEPNGVVTPKQNRKRTRTELEQEEENAEPVQQANNASEPDGGDGVPGEVLIRRKRVRH